MEYTILSLFEDLFGDLSGVSPDVICTCAFCLAVFVFHNVFKLFTYVVKGVFRLG